MAFKNILLKSLTILAACRVVAAHSWVEQVRKIDLNGAFTDEIGFPMHWVNRTAPGFNDHEAQNQILNTKPNPAVCKPKAGSYQGDINRLTASAGDYIALMYQENGHVTQPFITPRPYRDGLVSIYGTMNHDDSQGINDVRNSWTADGKGGDGKGQLLATHYYDDGQCYQNAGNDFNIKIYAERSKKYDLPEIICQSDLQLPDDLPETGTYTLMWVWDWPLIISDTMNTTEIYTSCAEITLEPRKSSSNSVKAIKFSKDTPINSAGISSQLANMYEATGLGIGTNSPAAPTGQDSTATADVSATTSAADSTTSTTKKHKGGVKTVTVTAPAETTTQWKTVTIGAGSSNGNAAQPETSSRGARTSAQATSAAQATSSVASSRRAAPTSNVPVVSVSKFLKARATGHARREDLP